MPNSRTTSVIEHLRRAVLLRDGAGLGDGNAKGTGMFIVTRFRLRQPNDKHACPL